MARKNDINFDYNSEIKKCKTIDDVLGKNGLVQRLVKDVLENILEAEMDEHLGRDKYQRQSDIEPGERNYRNGYSQKNLRSSFGDVDLDIPRDRKSEFEPQIVKKYETVCNELDKKIISLYAKGMTTSDIQAEIEDLYGITISPSMVSKITDKVIATATEWQNRMLDKIYPIVYLDAMYFKVRSNGKIVNKAVYICLGYTMEGYKDIRKHLVKQFMNEDDQDKWNDKIDKLYANIYLDIALKHKDKDFAKSCYENIKHKGNIEINQQINYYKLMNPVVYWCLRIIRKLGWRPKKENYDKKIND